MLDDASKLIDNSQLPSSEIPTGHIFTFEDALAEFDGDFSSIIEKIEAQSLNNGTDIPELGPTGSLSSWFDCALKEAGFEDTHSIGGGATTTPSSDIKNVCEETSGSSESRTRRSRNAIESLSTKHRNADSDEVELDLTDERKKRRYADFVTWRCRLSNTAMFVEGKRRSIRCTQTRSQFVECHASHFNFSSPQGFLIQN